MKQAHGFSLVELMISLALGLVITAAVIQVMVSSRVTNNLNQAVAQVQESGRFIMTRLTRELLPVGRYDLVSARVEDSVDTTMEAAFVQNRPVALAGDFAAMTTLGSVQAANGANDTLVVNLLAAADCSGARHGYTDNREFHVVNVYRVSAGKLTCTGYDGRLLTGQKAGAISSSAITLVDNVHSFQLMYGISEPAATSKGLPVQYVTANELGAARAQGQQVVTLRLGVLLKSDARETSQMPVNQIAVLNESPISTDSNHYFQVFSQTLALRNMKNFVRSAK